LYSNPKLVSSPTILLIKRTMHFKQKILNHYKTLLQDQEDAFRDMIAELALDAQNDAKSSAGDKHETALSMMHLEQEKLTNKLREILNQTAVLNKIDVAKQHQKIALGSLVTTQNHLLFISLALPKITIEGKTIIAVSPQSPLGKTLLGNEKDFIFKIGNSDYQVISVE